MGKESSTGMGVTAFGEGVRVVVLMRGGGGPSAADRVLCMSNEQKENEKI